MKQLNLENADLQTTLRRREMENTLIEEEQEEAMLKFLKRLTLLSNELGVKIENNVVQCMTSEDFSYHYSRVGCGLTRWRNFPSE